MLLMRKDIKKVNKIVRKIMKLQESNQYSKHIKAREMYSKLRKDYPGVELRIYEEA